MTMTNKCGTCTACCRVYAIPELQKPAGQWCTHCAIGHGCKIYETRPAMCADFACMWLQSHQQGVGMPEEMRPDRCKVVFAMSSNPTIMGAITMPGREDAWRKGAARALIDRFVAAGLRVVAGPPVALGKTLIDRHGERPVTLTEPDENGMQWGNVPKTGVLT